MLKHGLMKNKTLKLILLVLTVVCVGLASYYFFKPKYPHGKLERDVCVMRINSKKDSDEPTSLFVYRRAVYNDDNYDNGGLCNIFLQGYDKIKVYKNKKRVTTREIAVGDILHLEMAGLMSASYPPTYHICYRIDILEPDEEFYKESMEAYEFFQSQW